MPYVVLDISSQSVRTAVVDSAAQARKIVDGIDARGGTRIAVYELAAAGRDMARLSLSELRRRETCG
jgi:hypothetical protein